MNNNHECIFFLFTCVKNGRPYISTLFESLLKQTKVNFTHYIYEDGSSDPIEDLVDEYKTKMNKLHPGIDIIYEKNVNNIGLNMATRHCLSKVNLPYFIWLNCDDYVDSYFFEELEKTVIANPKCVLFRSNVMNVVNGVKEDKSLFDRYGNDNKLKTRVFKNDLLGLSYLFSHSAINTKLYRSINKNNVLLNERSFFNDAQVYLIASLTNRKFCFCDKAIAYINIADNTEGRFATREETFSDDNIRSLLSSIGFGSSYIKLALKFKHLYLKQRLLFVDKHYWKLLFISIYKFFFCLIYGFGVRYTSFYNNDFYWIVKSICSLL